MIGRSFRNAGIAPARNSEKSQLVAEIYYFLYIYKYDFLEPSAAISESRGDMDPHIHPQSAARTIFRIQSTCSRRGRRGVNNSKCSLIRVSQFVVPSVLETIHKMYNNFYFKSIRPSHGGLVCPLYQSISLPVGSLVRLFYYF